METIDMEEIEIVGTAPAPRPPIFKMTNGVQLAGALVLSLSGWKKTGAILGAAAVADIVLRQLSPDYATVTKSFQSVAPYRRVTR